MSFVKTHEEIEILKEGGRKLAAVLARVSRLAQPGVRTKELDERAEFLIREGGDEPAFKGYQPRGSRFPYPASLCVSVNDEVVHGIPGERALCEGDIVGLDVGLVHRGLFTDMAITVPVGAASHEYLELMQVTKDALNKGIEAARIGNRIGAISEAVYKATCAGPYGVVRELGGHGVGHAVHEEPFISNIGKAREGMVIQEGMVFAIEPMVTLGGSDVVLSGDGYTYRTRDGSASAHFEHTVAVTREGPLILTQEA